MAWIRFAVRVRSRQMVLSLIVASLVVAAVTSGDPTGLAAMVSFLGGIAILGVLLGWSHFWSGGAVLRLRARSDPTFAGASGRPGPDSAGIDQRRSPMKNGDTRMHPTKVPSELEAGQILGRDGRISIYLAVTVPTLRGQEVFSFLAISPEAAVALGAALVEAGKATAAGALTDSHIKA